MGIRRRARVALRDVPEGARRGAALRAHPCRPRRAALASLATQAGTGLFASDDIFVEGPLAAKVSGATVALATRIHNWNQWVLIVLVSLHVAAIAFYALFKRENLVRPMLTGRKTLDGPAADTPNRTALAAVLLGLAGVCVYWLVKA